MERKKSTAAAELRVEEEGLNAFVACLALGTLEAIKSGALPPEVGTWSLGKPRFWEPLKRGGRVSPEVLDVLEMGDELSAIQALLPRRYPRMLDEAIQRLRGVLAEERARPCWQAYWEKSSVPARPRQKPAKQVRARRGRRAAPGAARADEPLPKRRAASR